MNFEGIKWTTLPETNLAPENWWLEYCFPFGKTYFQVQTVSFREDNLPTRIVVELSLFFQVPGIHANDHLITMRKSGKWYTPALHALEIPNY